MMPSDALVGSRAFAGAGGPRGATEPLGISARIYGLGV
jgi:hypothetical protein